MARKRSATGAPLALNPGADPGHGHQDQGFAAPHFPDRARPRSWSAPAADAPRYRRCPGRHAGYFITDDPRYDAVDLDEAAAGLPPRLSTTIPFVGRVAEIAAVVAALGREDVRLALLDRAGGVGKTQLALHAVAALHDVLPDQAIVPLASCRDTASMLATIARTIGLRERDAQPLRQRLITALRERRMLLLLDNVEQALPAAAAR
ncbi:MAG: hypothetical protein U0031_06495 [Thermomicrobiales bacterium]